MQPELVSTSSFKSLLRRLRPNICFKSYGTHTKGTIGSFFSDYSSVVIFSNCQAHKSCSQFLVSCYPPWNGFARKTCLVAQMQGVRNEIGLVSNLLTSMFYLKNQRSNRFHSYFWRKIVKDDWKRTLNIASNDHNGDLIFAVGVLKNQQNTMKVTLKWYPPITPCLYLPMYYFMCAIKPNSFLGPPAATIIL